MAVGRRHPVYSRPVRHRVRPLLIISALVLLAVGAVLPNSAAARTPRAGNDTDLLVAAMQQAEGSLVHPEDPRATAEALVHRAVSAPNVVAATGALAELLRRSGLPIVSVDGSLIGLPDRAGYPDAMVEIELLSGVARQLRSGATFTFADLADVFPVLEITKQVPSWPAVSLLLGSYGKGEVPAFVATAGAAIRALGAERATPLDPFAPDEEQLLDSVQMMIIVTHLGLAPTLRSDATSFGPARAPRGGIAERCANLVDSFKNLDSMPEGVKALFEGVKSTFDSIFEMMGEELDAAVEKGILRGWQKSALDGFGLLNNAFSKSRLAAKYLSLLLFVDGARLRVEGTEATHYKHRDGETGRNVRVVANLSFHGEFDKRELPCFNLAGFEIPPDGPMSGQTIEWSFDQENRPTRGGNSPAHLVPLKGARKAGDALTSQTDGEGFTSIELTPPVENFPGEGEEHRASVGVRAKFVRDEADWEVGDFITALKGKGVPVATEAGIRKLTELSLNAMLPISTHRVTVGYHGAEPLVVKGRVDQYFALAYLIKGVEVDLVSCNERTGPWIGSATFGGTEIAAFGEIVQGSGLWNAASLPNYTSPITNSTLSLDLPDPENPPEWELIRGSGGALVRGVMKLLPDRVDWSKYTALRDGRMASPVGTLTIGIADIPNWMGSELTFTVYRVKTDARCGGDPPFHWER